MRWRVSVQKLVVRENNKADIQIGFQFQIVHSLLIKGRTPSNCGAYHFSSISCFLSVVIQNEKEVGNEILIILMLLGVFKSSKLIMT